MPMGERVVLAIEGSTGTCSAALLRARGSALAGESRWEPIAVRREADGRSQARVLLRMLDDMLEESGTGIEELGAVVVGTGPGTFTGVRITVATARALGLALSVPVLGVSTLAALAAGAAGAAAGGSPTFGDLRTALLVPVVDAHRDQVFYGLYRSAGTRVASTGRSWTRTAEFGVCGRGELGGVLTAAAKDSPEGGGRRATHGDAWRALVVGESRVLVTGLPANAVFQCADVGAEWLLIGQGLLGEPGILPQGDRLTPWLVKALGPGGDAAVPRPEMGRVGTPESVTPIYVRSPDADIHITKMRDPWSDGTGER
jgi:tRNA threonylcarbamoyladenosine biosynthesis protein TsaB